MWVHGFGFMVLGSWFWVHGSGFMVKHSNTNLVV